MRIYDYLSVLIPTYNEHEIIIAAVERVNKALPGAEIVIVDDGSTDGTVSVAENIKMPVLKIIRTNKNRGKGGAVREGIKYITRPLTAQIDADMQFLPEEIPNLLKPILANEADIVFGSRYLSPNAKNIEKGSVIFVKRIASATASALISLICLKPYTDVFAGMKSWKTTVMRDIDLKIDNFGYEAEIAIMAKKKHYRVIEVPITYKKRIFGESKIKFTRDTLEVSKAIISTIFRV